MRISTTAKRLEQLMSERNLKQVDILRLSQPFCREHCIKLGRSDLSQFVNGKTEPGQSKLSILSMALDVSEAWLMGFDVPPERESSVISPFICESNLSTHEQTVITAYRDQPEMQPAVCKILSVDSDSTPQEQHTSIKPSANSPYIMTLAKKQGVPPEFILKVMSEQDTTKQVCLADGTGAEGAPDMHYVHITDREYEMVYTYRFDSEKQAAINRILDEPAPKQKKKPEP